MEDGEGVHGKVDSNTKYMHMHVFFVQDIRITRIAQITQMSDLSFTSIWSNICTMCEDRGYHVYPEAKRMLDNPDRIETPWTQIDLLPVAKDTSVENHRPVLTWWLDPNDITQKLSLSMLQDMLSSQFYLEWSPQRGFVKMATSQSALIAPHGARILILLPNMDVNCRFTQIMKRLQRKFSITLEMFLYRELYLYPFHHDLVPYQRPVTAEEYKQLEKDVSHLSIVKKHDRIVRHYAMQSGQILFVERMSSTNGWKADYLRVE